LINFGIPFKSDKTIKMMTIFRKITICCTTVLLINTVCFAQNAVSTYRNPVLSGDFPDPTIIRVGNDYYASATTSDFAPCYPLFHSTDLVNWTKTGAVFDNPPEWIKGDCWAPELFYDQGVYYVYYTARKKENGVSCIGVATTTDITKGFKDHGIIIEWGKEAIDAFVFKDDDGKCYILWKAYGLDKERPIEILCSELSNDKLSLVGEAFSLTDHTKGWIGGGDEGQCLVKHGNYYYLLYSVGGCCDRKCDYRVHIARSRSLKGPWEQYAQNPLLQGGELWKCSGHGTLVQTPDNRFFYLYHAYHSYDFMFTGRQALLDELVWNEKDEWAFFKYGNTPSQQAETPVKNTIQKRNDWFYDNFRSEETDKYWAWDMNLSKPVIVKENGVLTMTAPGQGFCFRGISPQTGNYVMETSIVNDEQQNFKGLCVYGNSKNILLWGLENKNLKLYRVKNNVKTELFSQYINASETCLRIESLNAVAFRFAWSGNRKDWSYFPESGESLTVNYLPQWGKGVRVGLIVENNTGKFSFFSINNK
jgi:beta-xylosidase